MRADLQDLADDGGIREGRGVTEVADVAGGGLAEDTPHDLARARLRQAADEEHAIRGGDGALLNDPAWPYWGRYEGDEDTRRKPAYHNGTAWPWWLATYCEALAHAYPGDPRAQRAARAILGSTARLLAEDCLGQLPEIIDGDAPHRARGCDAQAWSVTETLRCWLLLHDEP